MMKEEIDQDERKEKDTTRPKYMIKDHLIRRWDRKLYKAEEEVEKTEKFWNHNLSRTLLMMVTFYKNLLNKNSRKSHQTIYMHPHSLSN